MVRSRVEFGDSGIDPYVDAYEEAQARDGDADLAAYLPAPEHPLYPVVLCELVRVDLEYGWMRGQPRMLEEYVARFPALGADPERLREVAFEECRLRRQAGETPASDDYHRRFGLEDVRGLTSVVGPDRPQTMRERLDATRFAEVSASRRSRLHGHAESIRTLREADPGTADRVAAALEGLPEPGTDFAGFRLIRELGRGAFGRVYLARQGDLADRPVALKISADLLGEPQTLAQLQHTHVVPIYSSHQVGPLRAVCMPYFGASTLADVLRDLHARAAPPDSGAALVETLTSRLDAPEPGPVRPPPSGTSALQTLRGLGYVQAVLWIGARLADGLAHAHERGIVHRDLKPANVLLTDEGQPMLLDFNLAADTKCPGAAASALVGGTLPYMAPEALQALRDGSQSADARGDLFGLGVMLHELLTGRHPYPIRRGAVDHVLPLMIADRRGPSPEVRTWNPAISPAAESIVRRCLEPDPSRRYQEARHLLDDLQRQLDDRPLRYAPEPSTRERARKWARRHPRLTSATTLGAIAAVLIVGLIAGYTHRQRRFGPIEAAHALSGLTEAHENALVFLLDPVSDQARRDEGVSLCRRALARYGVLDSPAWQRAALVQDLPRDEQARLRVQVGELLVLWARALARQAARLDPPQRAARLRDALMRNALAEQCYPPDAVPRVVWTQRHGLARLSGDPGAAEHARARALGVPLRSAREYALLALDDPEGTHPTAALPALAEASRHAPRDFALWMSLGLCHAAQGRLDEAEDCFTVAVVLRPESPWPYFHRGRVALERRQFEPARLDFDQVLRLRPGLAAALINRALARLGRDEHAGAIEDLTTALDRGATETRVYFIRAEARARAGDRCGADRDRAEGLRRIPVDAESWVARGLARLPGDPVLALTDFEEALNLDPRSVAALQNKAVVLSERLGRVEDAVAALDQAVSIAPDWIPARVGRGVLLARLGRRDAAHRDAEDATRRDLSGDTTYRVACIYALTARDDPADRARALRMLATALGRDASWVEVARSDPDLDRMRTQADFQNLLRAFAPAAVPSG